MEMVERWDSAEDKMAAMQRQIDDLEKRMMMQEKRKIPTPVVRPDSGPKE